MKKYSKEIAIIITVMAIIGGIILLSGSHTTHDHGDGKVHSHP